MTNDRRMLAHRTPARHLRQGDLGYPGSLLSSVDSNAIKRITAGVRACRWSSRQVRSGDWPSPSCTDQCRTKKRTMAWHPPACSGPVHSEHWPVFSDQAGAIPDHNGWAQLPYARQSRKRELASILWPQNGRSTRASRATCAGDSKQLPPAKGYAFVMLPPRLSANLRLSVDGWPLR